MHRPIVSYQSSAWQPSPWVTSVRFLPLYSSNPGASSVAG
jgi:hypothetical protein